MERRLASQYYSPKGYWKGFGAIKKLAQAAKVTEDVAKQWLFKQALGKSIFPLHVTYLDPNLTYQHPMRSTKQTFFFCHMISRLVAAKFTNTLGPLLTSLVVTKKLSL